jgi:S1-C subfamily serine protease
MTKIAKPSIQSLFLQMQFNGSAIATGTGFVYSKASDHYLITNRHNVTGRHPETGKPLSALAAIPNELVIMHNSKGRLGEWHGKTEKLLANNDTPLWHEHPVHGEKMDCVALRLTSLDDVEIYSYNEYDSAPRVQLGPADCVSVVGFPFGLMAGGACAIWATGFIASEPAFDFGDLPLMLIDCRGRPGQSGSPVIAYRSGGMVSMEDGSTAAFNGPITYPIGIYSGRINDQSDLGLVWKMQAIRELVSACP